VKLTDVFKLHPECYDPEILNLLHSANTPFEFPGLTYVSSVEDSKKLSSSNELSIIISASGMCEAGRVLHHLVNTIEDPKNTIIIVGYQAENTLGRKIVDGASEVRIYGEMYQLKAEVCLLNGFSGHADQKGLLGFAESIKAQGLLDKIILVHGELKSAEILKDLLEENGFQSIAIPAPGEVIRLK
jgi:metallo-beta-lactamase family protein